MSFRPSRIVVLAGCSLLVAPLGAPAQQRVHADSGLSHEHLVTTCVDVEPGDTRAEFGCFNVGAVRGLRFDDAAVYWHLHVFPTREAADASKGATGLVVEEDGRVWLSELGPRSAPPRGGERVAVIGPLELAETEIHDAVLSYAVMRPGDRSVVHRHPGPEGWYVIAGEQCLESPGGIRKAAAGSTMTVQADIPIELSVTGDVTRRAFALVIHDSKLPRSLPVDWTPSGGCMAP